jgi:putative hydrolase of the HAD superfamily
MRELRAICFDLDDTLWDVHSVLARAEAAVSEHLAARHPEFGAAHPPAVRMQARLELARAMPERAHDLTWLRTESMRRLALAAGLPARIGDEAFEVFMAHRNRVTLFDDVLPALRALGEHYMLATLSNGNADLEQIGLAPHFKVTLNAISVGAAKPDPRAFGAVATALRCDPAQIAYVGDDPYADVLGARAAGMQTVWINRAARTWPAEHAPATAAVRDLAELAALLAALRDGA